MSANRPHSTNEAKLHAGLASSHGGPRRGPGEGRGKKRTAVMYPRSPLDVAHATKLAVCVDDTDDVSAKVSTGYIAELLARETCRLGGLVQLGITRHQLYLGEGVNYTSHNSAMCFVALMPDGFDRASLQERFIDIVESNAAVSSDPGLCVVPADTPGAAALMEFGLRAQTRFCAKSEAYEVAARVEGCSLSEHGGTGEGVIGALAGCGLRLSGDDGRFRGTWRLQEILGCAQDTMVARLLCNRLQELVSGPVALAAKEGAPISGDTPICLDVEAKPVLKGRSLTLLCDVVSGLHEATGRLCPAVPLGKNALGNVGNGDAWMRSCDGFAYDNDSEERGEGDSRCCGNCLYRRWTQSGFSCMAQA